MQNFSSLAVKPREKFEVTGSWMDDIFAILCMCAGFTIPNKNKGHRI